jgi:hypothetical protein
MPIREAVGRIQTFSRISSAICGNGRLNIKK